MPGSCSSLWFPLWWNWSCFHPEWNVKKQGMSPWTEGGRNVKAGNTDLKESECCPLQEALGVAHLSVEFLCEQNAIIIFSDDSAEKGCTCTLYRSLFNKSTFWLQCQDFTDLQWSFCWTWTSSWTFRGQKNILEKIQPCSALHFRSHSVFFF